VTQKNVVLIQILGTFHSSDASGPFDVHIVLCFPATLETLSAHGYGVHKLLILMAASHEIQSMKPETDHFGCRDSRLFAVWCAVWFSSLSFVCVPTVLQWLFPLSEEAKE
jgi:hypothetical protein